MYDTLEDETCPCAECDERAERNEAIFVMEKGRLVLDVCSPALVCAEAQVAARARKARNQTAMERSFMQYFFL